MKQRCIVVDDEQTARNILKKYIADVNFLELAGEFKNALEALEFIQTDTVDLIFLDIEMPKLSGINFAKIIDQKSKIIFTTAHREFALEGFELNALDYLLKPFSFDRFLKAVQRTIEFEKKTNSSTPDNHIYVKVNKQMMKVYFSDLLYIEGLSNYVKLHTTQDTLVIYDKLSSIIKTLPNQFKRTHKSYIINTSKITLYTKEFVEIERAHIPISSTYRTNLIAYLENN